MIRLAVDILQRVIDQPCVLPILDLFLLILPRWLFTLMSDEEACDDPWAPSKVAHKTSKSVMSKKKKLKKKGSSLYIPDDTPTSIIGEPSVDTEMDASDGTIAFQPTTESTSELLSSLQTLQFNGEYADFSIKCCDDTYQVHKAIICPRAPFFRAAFGNSTKECEAAEVDLSEHDPTSVRLMVYYLYNLDYPHVKLDGSLGNHTSSNNSNLSHHCRLYALADFCQMNTLKTLTVDKFKKEAETHWNDPDFFEAIQFVYSATVSTDRSMRDAVVGVMMAHRTLLDRQEFKDLVKEIDLAYELLMRMHETGGIKGTRNCRYCGQLY
ncbi:hypothetical protein B0T11DRAFT_280816 [Plectosphaerella cucumerina]|uniref:BTB domain-containing protein n=1 Tax=Plectosphaerella cucumerina TaxID=40658 RepID=A0A8K0X381_9PEZI|nr:hypothetical protein B0T11DRAFT_280816 [Plectosphaerella cucumerina]